MITKSELESLLGDTAYIGADEIPHFWNYSAALSKGPIVEIGAGLGASATIFLMSTKMDVHSIESFTGDSEGNWSPTPERLRQNVHRAMKTEFIPRWIIHHAQSHDLAGSIKEIELLYIDGDHRYDSVKQDFEEWFPFVIQDGIVLIHDSQRELDAKPGIYARGWEGPTRLANELRSDARVKHEKTFFSTTAWRKILFCTEPTYTSGHI